MDEVHTTCLLKLLRSTISKVVGAITTRKGAHQGALVVDILLTIFAETAEMK